VGSGRDPGNSPRTNSRWKRSLKLISGRCKGWKVIHFPHALQFVAQLLMHSTGGEWAVLAIVTPSASAQGCCMWEVAGWTAQTIPRLLPGQPGTQLQAAIAPGLNDDQVQTRRRRY